MINPQFLFQFSSRNTDQTRGIYGGIMGKKRHSVEKIIRLLRQAEILAAQGKKVPEICRELGSSDYSYYTWRKMYGGMQVDQAKRLKVLDG